MASSQGKKEEIAPAVIFVVIAGFAVRILIAVRMKVLVVAATS